MTRKYSPIPWELYKITKRLQTLEKVERNFPGFLAFIRSLA
ncbi:MAG TPA: hypothetical protein VN704_10110 [Verrucomicrobiae bacterium]|nr:hypothetical protein [Verrucomicrobiae bacterium]